jgi:hypothetical protein
MLQIHFRPGDVDETLPGSDTCLFDVHTNRFYDVRWDSWSCCDEGGFAYTRTGPFAGPPVKDCIPFSKSGEDRIVVNGSCCEVTIDVSPRDPDNRIVAWSHLPISVALLGTEEVNAGEVDVSTLAFGPGEAVPAFDLSNPFIYWLSLR